jgi:hypothetical protein
MGSWVSPKGGMPGMDEVALNAGLPNAPTHGLIGTAEHRFESGNAIRLICSGVS